MSFVDFANQRRSMGPNVNSHDSPLMRQLPVSRLSAPPVYSFESEANRADRLVLNRFTLYETKAVNYQFFIKFNY